MLATCKSMPEANFVVIATHRLQNMGAICSLLGELTKNKKAGEEDWRTGGGDALPGIYCLMTDTELFFPETARLQEF